ncbi:hypothetical protein HPB52_017518 [Rhipicephalus sanguineus]|uniref:Uncharacterized protein n=1 Tax=Rhipicephalus sanguineus TaxID=34632 RepID=A0A9D4PEQ7_RHISA|nr:hypothetical protein HPB52_017518 [Rhipicephalus sanguineus]
MKEDTDNGAGVDLAQPTVALQRACSWLQSVHGEAIQGAGATDGPLPIKATRAHKHNCIPGRAQWVRRSREPAAAI